MLMNQRSLKFLVASCLLASGLSPWFAAWAAVPTMPVRTTTLSSVQSMSQLQAELLPRGIRPVSYTHLTLPTTERV